MTKPTLTSIGFWRDEVSLMDGDHCAAFVLQLLRQWHADEEWVDATLDEIRIALRGMYGKTRIAAALKLLRKKGYVLARQNPDNKQIRTLQYWVTLKPPAENGGAE